MHMQRVPKELIAEGILISGKVHAVQITPHTSHPHTCSEGPIISCVTAAEV